MLSETLTTALERYAIGPKIRALRLRRKLGLSQLGKHTGFRRHCFQKSSAARFFQRYLLCCGSLSSLVSGSSIFSGPIGAAPCRRRAES